MIRIYLDFVSPYSYLAWVALPGIAARHGQEIEPVPILFAAVLDRRGARGPAEERERRTYLIKDVLRRAHDLSVPFVLPPAHPFNPLLALRVASLPMATPTRRALIDRLFTAVWAESRDLTDRQLVATLAADAGLTGDVLAQAETPENKARLKKATDEALDAGAFGVPTLLVHGDGDGKGNGDTHGGELFFGSDSLPHLDRYLAGGDPITAEMVERWMNLPAAAQRQRPGG